MARYLVSEISEQVQKTQKSMYNNQVRHYVAYSTMNITDSFIGFLVVRISLSFHTKLSQINHQEKSDDACPTMKVIRY